METVRSWRSRLRQAKAAFRRLRDAQPRFWFPRARRALRRLRSANPPAAVWIVAAALVLVAVNAAYHAARKPTEVLAAVVPTSPKTPAETWSTYGPSFGSSSTEIVTPDLLAALAQVESAGDPLARTYWRWRWSWNPLEVYGPASSAVGLLQITDGTFAQARRLCIHDHAVARAGAWWDPRACWGNALYSRAVPSHAIEMTSAWLHQSVVDTLAAEGLTRAPLEKKQRLAAVIHLCGRERGAAYARRGFWALPGERCGDHDVAGYLGRVRALRRTFAQIAAK
jgi:Transglycosylase SLT domain